jgi:archaeosine synthase beta-subunit
LNGPYPVLPAERTQWIISLRPAREVLDPRQPYAFFIEPECSSSGEIVPVATIFLTNRECPWRCVMCDLWRNTLTEPVSVGAIPEQIDYALSRLPAAREVKLYNSGSFFDLKAIPKEDYPVIASQLSGFERVIVESHPGLVGGLCLEFRNLISTQLEVAMGLETAHPEVLELLNKRMTLEDYSQAAAFLQSHDIDLRSFILVQPPFMRTGEALYWAERSLDFAFDCGATAATLIPTRGGNGAMEMLQGAGDFSPATGDLLEAALVYGVGLKRGRVFADLWNLDGFDSRGSRGLISRLRKINESQSVASVTPAIVETSN